MTATAAFDLRATQTALAAAIHGGAVGRRTNNVHAMKITVANRRM